MKTKRMLAVIISLSLMSAFALSPANALEDASNTPLMDATAESAADTEHINENVPDENNIETGDINSDGKVDITDLTELSLAIIGDKTLTESQIKAADIDRNGKADLPDLARLRQYLSKIIDYEQLCSQMNEQREFREIADYRVSRAGLTYLDKVLVINSLDEFKEQLENLKYYPTTYEKWLQYNKLDVDFEKEILVIFNDNNSCNGEKQTVKNIKADNNGKIVLAVDDMIPMMQTALASNTCIFVSVPKKDLPEGKNITAVCEKNIFSDISNISDECTSYDLVSSFCDEEIYFNQPVNNIIDSVEKFNELNRVVSEEDGSVLRIYDNISEKISITDEFFSDNILLVSTLIEGAGAVNKSSAVCVDYYGNIRKAIKRDSKAGIKSDDINAWNLVTVVPLSVIEKKEELFGGKIDRTKFSTKIISMDTKDEWVVSELYF